MKKTWPSGRVKGYSTFSAQIDAERPINKSNNQSHKIKIHASPPLKLGERGGLLPFNLDISGCDDEVSIRPLNFDEDVLRASLLLFDRLDYPINKLFGGGQEVPPGLEDWSGYARSTIEFSGSLTIRKEIFDDMFLSTFNALNERDKDLWSIVRGPNQKGMPISGLDKKSGFRLKLLNLLPIPTRAVSYEEILNFKERRRAELEKLRHHLEELTEEVASEGFGGLKETIAVEKFMRSVDDYSKSIMESNFQKRMLSLEIRFSWTKFVEGLTSSIALNSMFPDLSISPILQALSSSISVESDFSLKKLREKHAPFEYFMRCGAEL